jgi:predicted DNA-binding transcriptional regulator AlpA
MTNLTTTEPSSLRDSAWAMQLLNYSTARRSAFWAFVHSNSVPHIRTGQKKIQFNEQAVMDWLARRSSTGRAT